MHLKQFTVQGEYHISSHVIPESVDYLSHIRVGFDSLQSVTVIHMPLYPTHTYEDRKNIYNWTIQHSSDIQDYSPTEITCQYTSNLLKKKKKNPPNNPNIVSFQNQIQLCG